MREDTFEGGAVSGIQQVGEARSLLSFPHLVSVYYVVAVYFKSDYIQFCFTNAANRVERLLLPRALSLSLSISLRTLVRTLLDSSTTSHWHSWLKSRNNSRGRDDKLTRQTLFFFTFVFFCTFITTLLGGFYDRLIDLRLLNCRK